MNPEFQNGFRQSIFTYRMQKFLNLTSMFCTFCSTNAGESRIRSASSGKVGKMNSKISVHISTVWLDFLSFVLQNMQTEYTIFLYVCSGSFGGQDLSMFK